MTLTEIANKILLCVGECDPETGEIQDDSESRLDELMLSLEQKADGYGMVYRQLLANAEFCKTEAKRLQERATAHEKRAEWLRSHLHHTMSKLDINRVNTELGSATIQRAAPSVKLTGEVPIEYMVQPPSPPPKPDKKRILEALKHRTLPFAELVESTYLRFR